MKWEFLAALLRIVASFLTNRELILRYKGKLSTRKSMTAGGPQGSALGCFLFLILINFAGLTLSAIPLGRHITEPLKKRKPLQNTMQIYIDDMTLATSINLKEKLLINNDLQRPLNYHQRTHHVLLQKDNPMQEEVNDLVAYTNEKQMRINHEKTNVILSIQERIMI